MKYLAATLLLLAFAIRLTAQEEEISLFDSDGNPVAYIAMDEDATIYTWSGQPVAYLESSSEGGFSVYGFNGKHLGWFVRGVMREHEGNGACGVHDVVNLPKLEPIKSIKQIKPIRSVQQIEPVRPVFSLKWSATPCGLFLYEGAE